MFMTMRKCDGRQAFSKERARCDLPFTTTTLAERWSRIHLIAASPLQLTVSTDFLHTPCSKDDMREPCAQLKRGLLGERILAFN